MSGLEGRARLLLRAYPPAYRAERGEEIIDTLLDASPPGRDRLTPREARSLVAAGLRARAAANRRQPAVTSLRVTLILAAALWLAWDCWQLLWFVSARPQGQILAVLAGLLVAATVVAPWFAPRMVTVLLALGTTVALGLAFSHVTATVEPVYLIPHVVPPLGLAIASASGRRRPPRVWLWLPGMLVAAGLLFHAEQMVSTPLAGSVLGIAGAIIAYGIACATVLWCIVDVRPAIAFLIGWEWQLLPSAAYFAIHGTWLGGSYFTAMGVPAAAAVALSIWRLRPQPRHEPDL